MGEQISVLVLGAGELGLSVLRNLARRAAAAPGTSVAVMLRPQAMNSPESRRQQEINQLRSLGIQFVSGDLVADSVDALAALFRPFHTIIGCTGFVAGAGVQRKLAQAVCESGIPRYVPWQFGVDYDVIGRGRAQDLFDEQLDVRDLLRAQTRTGWIIISIGMFTSFLFEPSFGVVDLAGDTVRALGSWTNSVTVTTSEDIGFLTTEILFAEPAVLNQVVYTAGDTISYAHLADTIEAVLGRQVQRVARSVQQLKDDLALAPDDSLRKYRVVFAEGRGVPWNMATAFNVQRGLPVTNVESWARLHLI